MLGLLDESLIATIVYTPVLVVGVWLGTVMRIAFQQSFPRVKTIWLRDLIKTLVITTVFGIAVFLAAIAALIGLPSFAQEGGGPLVVVLVFFLSYAFAFAGVFTISLAVTMVFSHYMGVNTATDPNPENLIGIGFNVFTIFVTIFIPIFILQCARRKYAHTLANFWLMTTVILVVFFVALLLISDDDSSSTFVLVLVLLPLCNAPLDWLSLGMTRGLLLQIERGRHQSVSSFAWALADVALALFFLFAVSLCCFIALFIANTNFNPNIVVHDAVLSIDELRDAIDGGDELSIGIWLMLTSTLIPTFLHFLVALAAFVSLPFGRKRALETAEQLQLARDEAVRRRDEDTNQSSDTVPVDTYARRWAMAYFFTHRSIIVAVWLLLALFLIYLLFTMMQGLFATIF